MPPLRIAHVTPELTPFVKTGGLGDVASALVRHLAREGEDVRVFLPLYRQADARGQDVQVVEALRGIPVQLGPRVYTFTVFSCPFPGTTLPAYFVDCPPLFHRGGVYTQDPDEHVRFLLLQQAALKSCQHLGWAPQVLHLHDWATALVPLYLRTLYSWDRLFARTRTVLTIHNLGYQGAFAASAAGDTGFAPQDLHLLHQDDLRAGVVNFLKHGILYASVLTTVSPTYALEIQTEEYGFGLHGLLRDRRDALVGILNGVDYGEWSPERDPHIRVRYSRETLERKEENKAALLDELRLPRRPGVPLAGVVSRLAWQKGFDLFFDVLPALLARRELQLVVLGSGEGRYVDFFRRLVRSLPARVYFRGGFSNELAHRIEAGADLFVMPSRYEPCGLNQMYSLRYGTVPVVRRTGGLADSVRLWNPATREGTGVLFDHFNADALRWALGTALDLYADRAAWRRIQENGMAEDFSWERQGARYVELYRRLAAG